MGIGARRIRVYWLAVLGALPAGATAADDYLEMDLEQLLQVSVTGSTLRDQALATAPSAVTVFTHDQIAGMGVDYLYELLRLVPGYQVSRAADHSLNYTYSARGRRNSSQAREILLLVDGRVFANPRTGSSDPVIPLFPVTQIERIEVIQGPGSALYGTSAFTGVINIITRKGVSEIKVSGGSDQQRGMDVLWSQQSGDWETSLFAHAYQDNGQDYLVRDLTTPVAEANSDPARSVNLDVGTSYKQSRLRLTYHRSDAENFYSLERLRNGFNDNRQEFTQLQFDQGFALADKISSTFSLSYSRGYQGIHTEIADDNLLLTRSTPASAAPFLAEAIVEGESYRVALANDWSIDERSSSQFGIEIREDEEVYAKAQTNYDLSQLVRNEFPLRYYGDQPHFDDIGTEDYQQSHGIYGQYLRQLTDATNLTLGLRYDDYRGIAEHFSPRLGLVHQLTANQTVKVLYGEAFRAPTLSETGLINNTRVLGNPDLKHELVKTWDFIWMGAWHRSSVSVNGFYSEYDQPIIAGLSGSARTYINGDKERSNGVSLEASQQLSSEWLLRITYSHFLEMPDSTFREADQLGSLMLNYHRQAWNWNLIATYQGARETLMQTNMRNPLASVWLVNSKLGYQFTPAWAVHLQIKNLLDERYYSPAQGNGIDAGVPNRGREWSLGVEWNW